MKIFIISDEIPLNQSEFKKSKVDKCDVFKS